MEQGRHWNRNTLFFIFALSGFAGLIYESIWSHYLKLFLGHAAYAQILVLVIYMGGMAIGAWVAAKYTQTIDHLFWYYAAAEGLLALFAFSFHSIFTSIIGVSYESIMPAIGSPLGVMLYKWTLSALIILPQSILLGATFPLMSNAIIRRFPNIPGFDIAMLYFTNSFGAAIGVLVSGFYLIPRVGLPGTIITAGCINLVIAALTWVCAYLIQYTNDTKRITIDQQNPPRHAQSIFKLILIAAGITGAASFMYEISWIRLLSMVLGSSTHAFELMLSAFILGIALGGLWIRKRVDALKNPIIFLSRVQILMGLLALGSLVTYDQSYYVMDFFINALAKTGSGYWLFNISSHLITMLVMLPVTFCAGMTLPLMTSILIKKGYGEKSVGAVYASNTLGAIIGIIAAIKIVLPMTSLKGIIVTGAFLDIVLAIFLMLWSKDTLSLPSLQKTNINKKNNITMAISGTLSLAALLFIGFFYQIDANKITSAVYRGGMPKKHNGETIVFKRDGKSSTITVVKNNENSLTIATNGKPDASFNLNPRLITHDEPVQLLTAALPLSLYNGGAEAAMVGFGSGITAHTLLNMPKIKRLDIIEIEPAMVEGARLFQPHNKNAYTSARSHIYYDDAKAFFSTYQRKYDLIISEPSNPWVSGVSSVFSKEFYKITKKHLTETGTFAQWLNTYETNISLIVSVLKAVNDAFPYYAIYSMDDTNILIIAKSHAPIGKPSAALFSESAIRNPLHKIGVNNTSDIALRQLATEEVLRPYLTLFAVDTNSDYFPFLDVHSVKSRFLKEEVVNLGNMGFVIPLSKLETHVPDLNLKSISPNHGFKRAKIAETALILKSGINGNLGALKSKGPFNTNKLIKLLSPTTPACVSGSKVGAWNNAFFSAASIMANYLSLNDLHKSLSVIGEKACVKKMPKLSRDLFAFFTFLSTQDNKSMVKRGKVILAQYPNLDLQTQAYLLSVTMLGQLSEKHYKSALQLWQEYRSRIFMHRTPATTTQVIFAYALEHYRQTSG